MKHPCLLAALLLALPFAARAQSVGIGTNAPAAGAALDIRATDRGLLIPRLTAGQRTAIVSPPQGLMVYQTDGTASGGAQTGFWYFAGTPAAWVFLSPGGGGAADNLGNHTATQNLDLAGNALTGSAASIGTTVGLGVRADGGLNIGQNTAGHNVYVGYQAGAGGTTNLDNQFVGYRSGQANTTGSFNYFSGPRSGQDNTTGSNNHFSGNGSGRNNTTGRENHFDGYASGAANTTGQGNQFSGYRSGVSNTTSDNNYFSGYQSGEANTTGSNNQFVGYRSGRANTTGRQNQFGGYQSGVNNTTGEGNQFEGYQSGSRNTTGDNNQFGGYQSGLANTTGNSNQFNGFLSGSRNTTGGNNLFVGYQSGLNNSTGSRNLALGYAAGPASGNLTNAGAIGFRAQVSQSNSLVLGGIGSDAVSVGIGTPAPLSRLSISPAATEAKITLWDNGSPTSHYGFGISGGQLNYHVYGPTDQHVFYAGGKNGNGTELLRIQGNGRVGIGTSSPQYRLDVAGAARFDKVYSDRTGPANLLPIAYGRIRTNGVTIAGTGNFTSSKNTMNLPFYEIQFTAASSLSGVSFADYIVLVTTNDGGTSPTVDTTVPGKLEVKFTTAGPLGGNVSNDFSFVIYRP